MIMAVVNAQVELCPNSQILTSEVAPERYMNYFYNIPDPYPIQSGNKCQLMATSLLREVTEPAFFCSRSC